jgi:hypothetical protein
MASLTFVYIKFFLAIIIQFKHLRNILYPGDYIKDYMGKLEVCIYPLIYYHTLFASNLVIHFSDYSLVL